jgi:hypothetical protein
MQKWMVFPGPSVSANPPSARESESHGGDPAAGRKQCFPWLTIKTIVHCNRCLLLNCLRQGLNPKVPTRHPMHYLVSRQSQSMMMMPSSGRRSERSATYIPQVIKPSLSRHSSRHVEEKSRGNHCGRPGNAISCSMRAPMPKWAGSRGEGASLSGARQDGGGPSPVIPNRHPTRTETQVRHRGRWSSNTRQGEPLSSPRGGAQHPLRG